jgi:hypothetical protein
LFQGLIRKTWTTVTSTLVARIHGKPLEGGHRQEVGGGGDEGEEAVVNSKLNRI